MNGFVWKLNRLRAMTWPEVAHRAFRWTGQKVEGFLVANGRVPVATHPVKPRLSLFPTQLDWLATWQQHFSLEQGPLDDLLRGKIGFFGDAPLDVGVPVNWHRDPLTGITAPLSFGKSINYRDDRLVGNIKILWELGRHQHLIPLAVAYACTGSIQYREAVTSQIEGWIQENPYGLGIHWCSALEVALRLISWAVVHSLLSLRDGDDGLFSAVAEPEKLGNAIFQQSRFVRGFLSRHSSANNHLIGELTGLWVACCVFDIGKQGASWADTAQRELELQAQFQVHADGVNKEQACYYHLWVLEYLLFAWIVGVRIGQKFSTTFGERIQSMATFLHTITPTSGVAPQIGDADDGFVTRFTINWPKNGYLDVLASVDAVIEEKVVYFPLSQKTFWYSLCLGKSPAVSSQVCTKNIEYPAVFPEGGYTVFKNGAVQLIFDAGPLGYLSIAAHGHADALSVCLAVDGEWWLVDPGTYAYHSEQGWRNYFRGTKAHNTLQVDGCDQSEIGGPFLWLQHASAKIVDTGKDVHGGQWVVGEHNGYQKLGVLHTRRLDCDATGCEVVISDEILGNGTHELAIHFHFAPDIEIVPGDQDGTWQVSKPGSPHTIAMRVDQTWHWALFRGSESPRLGWYSPALGMKTPACTLQGTWQDCLPVRLITSMTVR